MHRRLLSLGSLRRITPFVIAGASMSLFMVWCLPTLLAMRGIDSSRQPIVIWERSGGDPLRRLGEGSARLEVRRGVFSDTYSALRATSGASSTDRWPTGELLRLDTAPLRLHHPPRAVVTAPSEDKVDAFVRIETTLAGWPFRAFASEAWYSVAATASDAPPEIRSAANFGVLEGHALLVPLRPIVGGVVGDVLVWTSVSWIAVALPLALRRRKREKYGSCLGCGHSLDPHAVHRVALCPACGAALPRDALSFARSPEMHFQNSYVWFIFISSLDIMLTWKILDINGVEVNPVAAVIIDAWGMQGAVAFKFALVMWVIVMCELLARLRMSAGKFLAIAAICISALPVVWSLGLLTLHTFFPRALE